MNGMGGNESKFEQLAEILEIGNFNMKLANQSKFDLRYPRAEIS